jgi:hypothetical protein
MILLDTDHLILLESGAAESIAIGLRLADAADDGQRVAVSIVTYEEQMR